MTDIIHSKSAIHLATPNIPIFHAHQTITEVKKSLFSNGKSFNSINYVYIVSQEKVLRGVISIQELINADEHAQIQKVMKTKLIYVHPHTHRERVVQVALKNKIKAVPVIDKEGKLVGVITSDTILSIANTELTEELFLLEGINSKEFLSISTVHNSAVNLLVKRLPWLIVGLIGGLLAAQIISYFEEIIGQDVLLLSFIPLMVYVSDAVGSQSQTIYIRYIAVQNEISFLNYLVKELRLGLLIGLALSSLLFLLSSLLYSPFLGITLGASLFVTILCSIAIAIFIPWILVKNHKDPAVGSGPFATILRDLLSILIYFSVTQFFY